MAALTARIALDRRRNHLLRGLRVLRQVLDDQLDGHAVVIGMPAVVVGHERHRRVADLRFARELGFLQVGHADDVRAPRAIQVRLGKRRELRALHAHIGAAAVHAGADPLRARRRQLPERVADRMRKADVRDDAVAEKRRRCD